MEKCPFPPSSTHHTHTSSSSAPSSSNSLFSDTHTLPSQPDTKNFCPKTKGLQNLVRCMSPGSFFCLQGFAASSKDRRFVSGVWDVVGALGAAQALPAGCSLCPGQGMAMPGASSPCKSRAPGISSTEQTLAFGTKILYPEHP